MPDREPQITARTEPRHRNLIVAAGTLLLVALVVGLYAARSSQRQIYRVNHTHRVLAKIHETGALLRNAESEQRGFLITGGTSYELRAEHYAEQLNTALAELRDLVANIPTQRQRANLLTDATLERLTDLRATAQITRKSSLTEIKSMLGDESEVEVMGRIRELQVAMITEEEIQLERRRAAMESEIRFATFTILFTGGLALALGLVSFVVMRRSIVALNREAELLRQKETAETADREKSEFLANMSHEIRTPMNSVLGFAELLSGTETTPKQRQYLDAIHGSGRAMLSLINDILDLSKIEAGKITLSYQPVALTALFEEIRDIFSPQAEARGLKFILEVTSRVPDAIEFDQTRLRQILFNVVGNALKFTREGSITLAADATPDSGNPAHITLHLAVVDTGTGIAEDAREKIFEPFRQAQDGPERAHGGTGLGLSITSRLTELLGGTITLESIEDQGSTFHFDFPQVTVAANAPAPTPIPDDEDFNRLQPSLILAADDVPLNLDLIAGQFEGTHHRLVFARNGREAIDQARRHHPDLILLDLRMPELDGRAALHHLREDVTLRDIPVISVTASSMVAEEAVLREEFDGYLRKPFTRASLFAQLANHLRLRDTPAQLDPATPADSPDLPDEDPSTGNPNERWPALVERLRTLETETYPALSRSMSTRDLAAFAREIHELGAAADCPAATAFGEKLADQVERFQIAAMEATLRNFPLLVEGLAKQLPPEA